MALRHEPALGISSGTCRAQAKRKELFRLVEILLPNLGAFQSGSSVCLLRNTPSSVSHSHGSGPVPSSPEEGMSSGVTGFSLLIFMETEAPQQEWQQTQHHLICLLKKKADDARRHCTDLEQLYTELEKLRTEDAVKMKTQTQRIQHSEGRFTDLANNHEEMIQIKGHKKRHMQLWEEKRQENEMLFSQTLKEKEAEVLQLTAQARKLSQQLDSLQEKCASESHRAQEEKELLEAQSQRVYAWEVDELKKHLQEEHQQTVAWVERAESQQRAQGSELQAKLERMNEEKEWLLNLAMERGKALQEKQWEIQKLGKNMETVQKARQRAGKRLVKGAAAVSKDLKVQELERQLESSKQAYNELLLQFDAYRKHSMDLLDKEKAVNVKLHHFTVQLQLSPLCSSRQVPPL
ncbi:LOW QUALITY PROTEIN: coiled-coil domain-containing protein 89 [Podargus strigoides]